MEFVKAVIKKRISLLESRILRRYKRMDIIMGIRAWRIEYEGWYSGRPESGAGNVLDQ